MQQLAITEFFLVGLLHYCIVPMVSTAAAHFLGILWNIVLVLAASMDFFSPIIVKI